MNYNKYTFHFRKNNHRKNKMQKLIPDSENPAFLTMLSFIAAFPFFAAHSVHCMFTMFAAATVILIFGNPCAAKDFPPILDGAQPAEVPAPWNAVVLFDGKTGLSQWNNAEKWTLGDGFMEVHGGAIYSKQKFGSCILHVEFMIPESVANRKGQNRGNSGVFLMNHYEIQILDSWHNENDTYVNGTCGSIYTKEAPRVNVCRNLGEWQSYDIEFHAPRFDAEGKVTRRARMTVYQNGIQTHRDFELDGHTTWPGKYVAHSDREPIRLQDHGSPVQFRNVWVVPTED